MVKLVTERVDGRGGVRLFNTENEAGQLVWLNKEDTTFVTTDGRVNIPKRLFEEYLKR